MIVNYQSNRCRMIALSPEDQFLVIATDGVWEFITSQEAVDILAKKPPSKVNESSGECSLPDRRSVVLVTKAYVLTLELLAYEAWRRWVAEEENVVDDVTCIVVWFNTDESAAATVRENGKSNNARSSRRSSLPASPRGTHVAKNHASRRDQRCGSVAAAHL